VCYRLRSCCVVVLVVASVDACIVLFRFVCFVHFFRVAGTGAVPCRPDLMVKKLRYYARFIVVCLLLKKMKLVRDLVRVSCFALQSDYLSVLSFGFPSVFPFFRIL